MRNFLIVAVVLGLGSCQSAEEPMDEPEAAVEEEVASLDAVEVDSDINTVELENEWVRVIRTKTPPGHTTNKHTHGPGVSVSLTGGKGRATLDDGEVMESETEPGEVGDLFEFAGVPHVTENLADHETEGIIVELKIEDGAPVEAPSHDAVEVDGEHHTVELENDLVRVVRMHYPEGYATPLHNHYPGVTVVLGGTQAKSAPEGEEAEPADIEVGSVSWSDGLGEPHVTTNLGEPMHIIRVELKKQ